MLRHSTLAVRAENGLNVAPVELERTTIPLRSGQHGSAAALALATRNASGRLPFHQILTRVRNKDHERNLAFSRRAKHVLSRDAEDDLRAWLKPSPWLWAASCALIHLPHTHSHARAATNLLSRFRDALSLGETPSQSLMSGEAPCLTNHLSRAGSNSLSTPWCSAVFPFRSR